MANSEVSRNLFLLMGVGMMITYNVLISNHDAFNLHYKSYIKDIGYVDKIFGHVQLLYTGGSFIAQVFLVSFLSRWINFTARRVIGSIAMCLCPLSFALLCYTSVDTKGYLIRLVSFSQGFFGSFAQNSAFGISGLLGPKYIERFMLGYGLAGIIASAICLFLKYFGRETPSWAAAQFLLGCSSNLLAVALYFLFSSKYQNLKHALDIARAPAIDEQEEPSLETGIAVDSEDLKCRSTLAILRDAYPQMLNLFFTFFVTFLIFPSAVINWKAGKSAMITHFCVVFTIFDAIGRYAPSYDFLIPRTFPKFLPSTTVLLRFLLVPCAYSNLSSENFSPALGYVIIGTLALTNGLYATAACIRAPGQVTYPKEKNIVNTWMSCTLIAGIAIGQLVCSFILPVAQRVF